MKLYNVADMSGLFEIFDHLQGRVTVTTADGSHLEWKTERAAVRALMEDMDSPQLGKLSIGFENRKDTNQVMSFLMECHRTRRQAA